MVLRKDDLTDYAINLGVWTSLCEAAGIEPEDDLDQEIRITSIEGEEV